MHKSIILSALTIPEFPLQNILFYYDSEQSSKPSGVLFLEGCYCERLVSAPSGLGTPGGTNGGHGHKHGKEEKLQVSVYYVLFTVKLNRQIIIIPELGSWSFSNLVTTYMATGWIWTKSGGTQTRAIFLWLNYSKCNKVGHWTGEGGGEGAECGCIVTESIRVWRCEGESGVHVPLLRCRRGLRWV